MQGMLRLLKNSEIRETRHIAVREVLTLAQSLCISYTPWVKNLLILQNTDAGAFALVSAMLKANASQAYPSKYNRTAGFIPDRYQEFPKKIPRNSRRNHRNAGGQMAETRCLES